MRWYRRIKRKLGYTVVHVDNENYYCCSYWTQRDAMVACSELNALEIETGDPTFWKVKHGL